MPFLICPVDWCKFHDGDNCTKQFVKFKCRSDDYDVTLACPHQAEKPKICSECGAEHTSRICECEP